MWLFHKVEEGALLYPGFNFTRFDSAKGYGRTVLLKGWQILLHWPYMVDEPERKEWILRWRFITFEYKGEKRVVRLCWPKTFKVDRRWDG